MKDLRRLDLNLLVIFEAIYSARNISHAAQKLGMSQPTVSNALSRLRANLDDPLFVRAGRGVEPTQKASRIIEPVREVLKTIKADVVDGSDFDPETSRQAFRIVLLDMLEPILMPTIIRQIQDFKSVTLESLPISTTSVRDALNSGTLDLALSAYVHGMQDFECETIGRANVVIISRKDHPEITGLFTRDHFEQIGHVALIPQMRALSRVDEVLYHQNLERHITYAVTKFWSFPYIVAHTDLIALFPGDFAQVVAKHYPIDIHPLPFEMPEQQIYMTWKKDRTNSPGHRWLREQIRQAYHQGMNDRKDYDTIDDRGLMA